jgi:hypothetical protein
MDRGRIHARGDVSLPPLQTWAIKSRRGLCCFIKSHC